MNPNILKIAHEAGLNTNPHYPGGWPNDGLPVIEDFAHKLLLEAIDVLAQELTGDISEDMNLIQAIMNLENHFGLLNDGN
jgi:hypothetical protein